MDVIGAVARRALLYLADTRLIQRGCLGPRCNVLQIVRRRFQCRISHGKCFCIPFFCQIFRIGQPGMGIFGGLAGHCDSAFSHLSRCGARDMARGNHSLALPDKNAQANVQLFGPFRVFQCLCPHINAR